MFNSTSSLLEKDIVNAMATFQKVIDKLQETSSKAKQAKDEKTTKIAELQKECESLEKVADKAKTLSGKLSELFKV